MTKALPRPAKYGFLRRLMFLSTCLTLTPMIQSCGIFEAAFQASGDVSTQRYSGKYYPNPSPTKEDIGLNLGWLILMHLRPNLANSSSVYFRQPTTLFASSATGFESLKNELPDFQQSANSTQTNSLDFLNNVRISSGLEFIQKKSKDGAAKVTLNYLNIPVQGLYFYELSNKSSIFAGLGPYFAYGIGGKTKTSFDKVNSFDKEFGFKRFDAGLGFSVGYKIPESFSVRLGYDIGLANILRDGEGDKVKNRTFSLNVSYPLKSIFKK